MDLRQLPDKIGRERAWKGFSWVTGFLGALVAKKVLRAIYRATRRDTAPAATPFDPTEPGFRWPDALVWAAAAGIGLVIAKVVSARIAAIGWKVATHTPPPGSVDEPAVG